jgi:pilus assembly protein CpaB
MDTKRILLVGGLGVVALVGFLQLQKLSTPAPVPVQTVERNEPVITTAKTVDIIVAILDIPMGTRITPEHITWKKWPEEALTENLIDNISRPDALAELNTAVTRQTIYAGEPIVQRKVVLSGERGQMSALLKPGMRAIATRISVDSAAGGFIKPNDRVDIVLTTQLKTDVPNNTANTQSAYLATTIFENVHVLAIDQTYGQGPDGQATVVGSTALLELSQSDAEALIEAQSKGDMSMTLRGLENRRVAFIPSMATTDRKKSGAVTSMTIHRNGQSSQVAIQGQ